jgi:hypothetical protein
VPTFDLSEYEQFTRWLKDHSREAVQRGLVSTAVRAVGVIQNEIIPAEDPPPIFDGHYRNAWHAEPTDRGADIYNDMPYAPPIEGGVRAENVKISRKMIDALAEWARRKGMTGHAPGARSSPAAFAGARQIAWAIARTMQGTQRKPGKGIFNRDGKEGLGILKKLAAKLPDMVREEVTREIERSLK